MGIMRGIFYGVVIFWKLSFPKNSNTESWMANGTIYFKSEKETIKGS